MGYMANSTQRSIVKLAPHPFLVMELERTIVRFGGLKIIGFGIFKVQKMKAKTGFNPYTKKPAKFPAYNKITFTPSSHLKKAIQKWTSKI